MFRIKICFQFTTGILRGFRIRKSVNLMINDSEISRVEQNGMLNSLTMRFSKKRRNRWRQRLRRFKCLLCFVFFSRILSNQKCNISSSRKGNSSLILCKKTLLKWLPYPDRSQVSITDFSANFEGKMVTRTFGDRALQHPTEQIN